MPVRQWQEIQVVPRQAGLNKDTLRTAPRELRTARLLLQAPRREHAPALADFFNASLPDWPFIGWPKFFRDPVWAEQFCVRGLQYIEEGENLIFNVFEGKAKAQGSAVANANANADARADADADARADADADADADARAGVCIGRIDLHSFDFDAPRCEIGYVGDPRVSGRGCLREATLAVLDLGFALGLARIEAFSDVRNQRAVKFALDLGFEREGVVRHRERDPQGELCSQVLLARLRPADSAKSHS